MPVNTRSTLSIVLAGGVGSRLHPLTEERTKPAVPIGGKYRIIDFALTNCLHSGLRRILVLTQYKSHSLQKHIRDGWSIFNPELGEYITTVPPQMRTGDMWYRGTADAIYQNLYLLERSGAKQVVILPGDHIYRMDYAPMVTAHIEKKADLTVACMKVPLAEAHHFGIMSLDQQHRITTFHEKPETPEPMEEDSGSAMASMGIYVFTLKRLIEILKEDHHKNDSSHDFGNDIIPRLIKTHAVQAYPFGGARGRVSQDSYWRDVGTLDSYYQANMDLLQETPPMNLYQDNWPIRTYSGQNPPARTVPGVLGNEGISINSITASGVTIAGGSVQHSILFTNVHVGDEAMVHDSLLFDDVKVGAGAELKNCIVDKGVVVPSGEIIGYDEKHDRQRFTISPQGIIVVPKGYQFN